MNSNSKIRSKKQKALSRTPITPRLSQSSLFSRGLSSFVDVNFSNSISTSLYVAGLTSTIASNVFATVAPASRAAYSADLGGLVYMVPVRVSHIAMNMTFIGAQSNTIAAGDLFNNLRFVIANQATTNQEVSLHVITSTTSAYSPWGSSIYFDKLLSLPSQAFDSSSNYNVPQVIEVKRNVPVNRTYNFFNIGSGWDSQAPSLRVYAISDSSVAPNPTMEGTLRIFFSY